MATLSPPIAPPGAGVPIEALAGGIPVRPEIKGEKIPMGAPAESPVAILGIIEEEQLAGKPAREIHEAVAAADLKPEAAETKRQETKQILEELGKVLLEAGDTRAALAAVGLSAGDTPMADEFRQKIAEMLVMGKRPSTIEEARWAQMQNKSSPVPSEQSEMSAFFQRHNFPLDLIDQWGGELAGAQQILTLSEKGEYTPIAYDLQRAMGWGEKNPMPNSHEALAKQFGDDPAFTEQMKGILKTEKRAEIVTLFNRIKGLSKEKGPGALQALLILASMLEGMIQQGTADAGQATGASH